MAKHKSYVVWVGRSPGVYDSWEDCKAQVDGFAGAKFKGYPHREFAEAAYLIPYQEVLLTKGEPQQPNIPLPTTEVEAELLAVDPDDLPF